MAEESPKGSSRNPTVTLCRGCCCGTTHKHPDIDHEAQEQAFRAGLSDGVRLRVSDCLLACDNSNVVVVSGHTSKPVWLRGILTERLTTAVIDWANEGGELPPSLRARCREAPVYNGVTYDVS